MVDALDTQDTALYDIAVELMHNRLRGLSSAGDVKDVIIALSSALNSAIADAEQTWNQSHVVTLTHLPPELLAHVFSWLSTSDRARVTQVCRDWRAIAIAHPALWTQITMAHTRLHHLDSLLRRSGTLCLTLDLGPTWGSEDDPIIELLVSNMGRILSLCLSHPCPSSLFNSSNATRLRKLEIRKASPLLPSANWAPNLQDLALEVFSIPCPLGDTRPFSRVTRFYGSMKRPQWGERRSDARELFRLCPHLEALHLDWISPSSLPLLPTAPVPPSLSALTLRGNIDLGAYASTFLGHQLQYIDIQSKTVTADAVPLFFSGRERSWTLSLRSERREHNLQLCNMDGCTLNIPSTNPQVTDYEWSWLPLQASRLTSVALSASLFILPRNLYLPALVSLEITYFPPQRSPDVIRAKRPEDPFPFHAPNLEALILEIRPQDDQVMCFAQYLCVFVRSYLGVQTRSLSRLTLKNYPVPEGDVAVLSEIAQEVIVMDESKSSAT